MSYSFFVKGATRNEVSDKIADEFEKIVEAQPIHKADRNIAESAANAALNLLAHDASKDVTANVHGSISSNDDGVRSVSFGVGVGFAERETTTG